MSIERSPFHTFIERASRPILAAALVLGVGGAAVESLINHKESSTVRLSPNALDALNQLKSGPDGLEAYVGPSDEIRMGLFHDPTVAKIDQHPIQLGHTEGSTASIPIPSNADPELITAASKTELSTGTAITPQEDDIGSEIIITSTLNNIAGKYRNTYKYTNPDKHYFGIDNYANPNEIKAFFTDPSTTLTTYEKSQDTFIDGTYTLRTDIRDSEATSVYTRSLIGQMSDYSGFNYSQVLPHNQSEVLESLGIYDK